MDVQAVIVVQRERQPFEKSSLCHSESAARPLHDDVGLDIQLFARVADRTVVIAEHGPCTFFDKVHDGGDRPLRVGAIADIVAEQHDFLCAKIGRLRKTCAERLSIGVDV